CGLRGRVVGGVRVRAWHDPDANGIALAARQGEAERRRLVAVRLLGHPDVEVDSTRRGRPAGHIGILALITPAASANEPLPLQWAARGGVRHALRCPRHAYLLDGPVREARPVEPFL